MSFAASAVGALRCSTASCHRQHQRPSRPSAAPGHARSIPREVAGWSHGARRCRGRAVGCSSSSQANASGGPGRPASPAARRMLWMAAVKPLMYSVAWVPVFVGGGLASWTVGVLSPMMLLHLLLASTMIIGWLNLSNDAFDTDTGVDATKPESVVNLTGSRGKVLALANALLAAGVAWLSYTVLSSGGTIAGLMLAAAIACGYVYQGPPFRLSYRGLGEPLCFAAFGPLATTAFYLCFANAGIDASRVPFSTVPLSVWAMSALVGLSTTVILLCSHFHQIEGDRRAGKMSPIVRLGTAKSSRLLRGMVRAFYVTLCVFVALSYLPPFPALFSIAAMPLAARLCRQVEEHHDNPEGVRTSKVVACKWHLAQGMCMTLGLLFSGTPW
ncbi:unnamed protein product [Pedinophyceae sp. YPF-701]|nr:unnamed protein product [Pedinophyceae sp. YPF-701]